MLGLTSAFNYMPVLVLHYANKLFDLIFEKKSYIFELSL